MTKNNDTDNYKYSGYGIIFDRKGEFSVGNGFGRNCIIFGVDMSPSVHVDNKKKYILILVQLTLLKITKNFGLACIIMEQTGVY